MICTVIPFDGLTKLDLPVDKVIEAAKGEVEGGVVIIGWDKDGILYFASSIGSGAEVLWLIEKAKLALLDVVNG
jgi:hypothetical protein